MLACVDGELRVLAVNPAWVDGFGAVARSLEVLIHPADRLRVAAALAGVAAGAAGEVTGRFAMRDGGYRALTLRAIRGRAGLHLSARDVEGPHAELAEVKRRLAAVYETMQELAYTTDERGS